MQFTIKLHETKLKLQENLPLKAGTQTSSVETSASALQPSQNWLAASSMSPLLWRFDRLHSRRKIYYFCFVTDKEKKAERMPKKKLPENNLKVKKCLYSEPTVFTSRYFKHKRHSDLSSVTKAEIFITFIEVLEKMSLSRQAFDWQLESNLSAFIV